MPETTRPTLIRGEGEPVTVFAHGFGSGIAETRPYAGGVHGTKVFYTARGHDGEPVDDFSYAALAADLRSVADATHARRAFGVSMGAGALTRLLSQTPDRFDRVVFFLPAVLDVPRGPEAMTALEQLHGAVETADLDQVARAVTADLPATVRDTAAARTYAMDRARVLTMPSMRGLVEKLATGVALERRTDLARVTAPALVLGCRNDPAHPAAIAEELAAALPTSTLRVFDEPDVMWTQRDRLRVCISEFLNI